MESKGRTEFSLDAFQGPLDVLLHLISSAKIHIYDIPITEITKQYLELLATAPESLEAKSDFYAMAATLLYIKSQMLIPGEELSEDYEDPRSDLVEQLIKYQECKLHAKALEEREGKDALALLHPRLYQFPDQRDEWELVDTQGLLLSFVRVMRRFAKPNLIDILEEYTIHDKVTLIKERLGQKKLCWFSELIMVGSVPELIAAFLAVLELAKTGVLRVSQISKDDDIKLERVEGPTQIVDIRSSNDEV